MKTVSITVAGAGFGFEVAMRLAALATIKHADEDFAAVIASKDELVLGRG